jgi:hypothetical protein
MEQDVFSVAVFYYIRRSKGLNRFLNISVTAKAGWQNVHTSERKGQWLTTISRKNLHVFHLYSKANKYYKLIIIQLIICSLYNL